MNAGRARATAFAPATIANVACGFDVLGLALETPGDTVAASLVEEPGLVLSSIEGDEGRLPRDLEKNTATVAARKILEDHPLPSGFGIRLELRKGLPLASGMGSSAASAVAAAFSVSALLDGGRSEAEILGAALEGERAVAGSGHPDNAAACLFGGIVLVRRTAPLDLVRLPVPQGLSVALLRPRMEISTRDSRLLLGDRVRLSDAVRQWANVGSFVAALYSGDLDLLSRSLEDVIAEPLRSRHVPGFAEVKAASLRAGALGSSLSGSGPSIFALCRDLETAERAATEMATAFRGGSSLDFDVHVSRVSPLGARLLEGMEST